MDGCTSMSCGTALHWAPGASLRRARTQPRARARHGARRAARVGVVTAAAIEESTAPARTKFNPVAAGAVNALFNFEPFFALATKNARDMMVKRGSTIGVDWAKRISDLENHDWEGEYSAVNNSSVVIPNYYKVPFHAYKEGNLSWQAAWELDCAAVTVHAPVFDAEAGKIMDPDGDAKLRSSYNDAMVPQVQRPVKDIVDLGCATGLSSMALQDAFPEANITGVDLSPFFLSVGEYNQRERRATGVNSKSPPVRLVHAANEATGLEAESQDLVSMCLVAHELPRDATLRIMDEAMRLLRPGGAFTIMEMNPYSPFVEKIQANLFAFTAFKATEPYLDDYMSFDLIGSLRSKGFTVDTKRPQRENTPRHRTIVAYKN